MKSRILSKLKIKSLSHYLTLLSLSISVVATILLLLFLYSQINEFIQNEYKVAGERTLNQSVNSIQRDLDNMNYMMQASQNNEIIITSLNVLDDDVSTPIDNYRASEQLKDYLFFLSTENTIIEDVLIISPNSQYSSSGLITNYELNGAILENSFSPEFLFTQPIFLDNITLKEDQSFDKLKKTEKYLDNKLFFATNIYDLEDTHKAMLLFILDKDFLLGNLLAPDNYQIMYNDQTIFSGEDFNDTKLINDLEIEQETTSFLTNEIYPYGLQIFYNLNTYEEVNFPIFILLFIAISIIIYFISYILSNYVAKAALQPIYDLLDWIKNQKRSNEYFQYNQNDKVNRLSFKNRLFAYFFLTILFPMLLISGIYYLRASNEVLGEMLELRESEHESKTALINSEIDRIRTVLANYAINPELMRELYLESERLSSISSYATTLNIDSISIYNQNDELWFSTSESTNKSINDSVFINKGSDTRYFFGLDQDILSIGLPIFGKNVLLEGNGTVTAGIDRHFFHELPLVEMVESENVIINDKIYWDINQGIFDDTLNLELETDDYHEFYSELNINDWEYSSILNVNDIKSDIAEIFIRNSYIFFIVVIVLFVLSYFLTGRVIKPFNDILNFSKKYDHEALESDYFTFINGIDEIHELRKNFSESIIALNNIMEEKVEIQNYALREEYEKKEIQLLALQNQVNPHFLYNSLENLLYLVEMGETDRAINMISSLAKFFQFVTNRETIHIPISKEIEFTENYLEIMRERFINFEVEWDIDSEVLDAEVIKLILQPIVENTIHHGVRHTDKLIHLYIKIVKEKNKIRFMIADNALGIDKQRLKEIQSDLNESTFNKSGIFNTNDRLNLYYGENYKFEISSELNEGTKVSIEIPTESN